MIYLVRAACRKLNLSHRHLSRLAEKIGKKPTRIGSRTRFMFTERDLELMSELRKMRNPYQRRKVRLPTAKTA